MNMGHNYARRAKTWLSKPSHYKGIIVGLLLCVAGFVSYEIYKFYFPAQATEDEDTTTTTTAATYQAPVFRDWGTKKTLANANMQLYVVGLRNDTGGVVLRYQGGANGLLALHLEPVAGSTYKFTKVGMYFWGSDTGELSTGGVFSDHRVRTYQLNYHDMSNHKTGGVTIDCPEYRSIATAKSTYTDINNTIATIAAGNPVQSLPTTSDGGQAAHASNLTMVIMMSQSPVNKWAAFPTYEDTINSTRVGVFIGLTTNASTTTLAATYLKCEVNGATLTALTSVGTANTVYYELPGWLTQTAVTVHFTWTAASYALATTVVAISATTAYWATAAAPQTALLTL
jgi:hypothetical protein